MPLPVFGITSWSLFSILFTTIFFSLPFFRSNSTSVKRILLFPYIYSFWSFLFKRFLSGICSYYRIDKQNQLSKIGNHIKNLLCFFPLSPLISGIALVFFTILVYKSIKICRWLGKFLLYRNPFLL